MKTNVKATNIELSDAISTYIDKKMGVLDKLIDPSDESASCDVEVGKETTHHKSGNVFFAEFNLHIAHKYLRARSVKETLNAALDDAQNEMEREIKSYKDKRITMIRKGSTKIKRILKRLRF